MSLLFISIGNGSIRACVTSLGGIQFQLPEQQSALEKYFSHFYFAYYFGILFSKLIPPSVRAQTSCFGQCDCYTAVFGVLGGAFFCCWGMIELQYKVSCVHGPLIIINDGFYFSYLFNWNFFL